MLDFPSYKDFLSEHGTSQHPLLGAALLLVVVGLAALLFT
jgi:hypothetical protein